MDKHSNTPTATIHSTNGDQDTSSSGSDDGSNIPFNTQNDSEMCAKKKEDTSLQLLLENTTDATEKEFERDKLAATCMEGKNSLYNYSPNYQHCNTITGLKYPWGIAVNSNIMVVAEWGGDRVTIMDSQGQRKLSFGNKEHLENPRGVRITDDDYILVTDSSRVLKYTLEGNLVKYIGGTIGANQQQFDSPAGMAIHPHNNRLYVADSNNHRIQILGQDLSFHGSFGGKGSQRGKFYLPWDVAVDSQGIVYVTEGNSRIQKFTPDGQFLTTIGKKGNQDGEINRPASITIDSNDIIHITDLYNNCITMFDTSGQCLCCHSNRDIKESLLFKGPCGTAVINNNTLYVVDSWDNSVKIFKY